MGLWNSGIAIFGIICSTFPAADSMLKLPGDECTDYSHRNGTCSPLRECTLIQEELNMGKFPTSCGFSGGRLIVCCPGLESRTISMLPLSDEPVTRVRKPGDRAKYWCEEYSKLCPKKYDYNGKTAGLPQIFTHMAAVGYGPRNGIHWKCGGSLISEKFILTAAHCLEDSDHGSAIWVLLGTQLHPPKEGKPSGKRGQIHEVVHRIPHPEYRPPEAYNDIALIEIGPSITSNASSLVGKELHPACLRPDADIGYLYNIVTQWSGTGFGEDPKLELLRVAVEILDDGKCNETFVDDMRAKGPLLRGFDLNTMCAGLLKDGKDICLEYSGGPLQFPIRGECQYEIIGILSFGKACSYHSSLSAYTRVSSYIEWIEDNVWPHPT